ncbi:inner centromere protein [Verticillium alfalfae VaMs.102]|uniref:Inner centromere protein n=1 Tax=Verticillium alfalfae (strain VaMs.102 / ATCC MYA-4576 / FGSC 10136) TaxID=526221 RepID=C9S8E7_VERA1|nr:inner centromere protein [Verticillium alfalfae VaMs.102]EEY14926.1 inner centromere protein [Verticillium alfalfae VaMs.102]
MAAMRGARVPVGSATWIAGERSSAEDIVKTETEEFSYSVRNEFDWLNEHMADVFNENAINVAEMFKTPGKLRGKTPRTARKVITGEPRVPLSDIFSSASKGVPTPFTQQLGRLQSPRLQASSSRSPLANKIASPLRPLPSMRPQPTKNAALPADSGYYGSQSQDVVDVDHHVYATQSTQPFSPVREADTNEDVAFHVDEPSTHESPTVTKTMQSPTMTFQTAREEQTTRVLKDVTQKMASPVPNPSPVRSPAKQTSTYPIISPPSRFAHSSSPKKSSPLKTSPAKHFDEPMSDAPSEDHSPLADEAQSPSEGSSPIRPVVRKSSLNFASLPAREPLTHKKSLGARQSRPSHDSRQSYLGRHTGGKSLSNVDILSSTDDEDDYQDGMELDGIVAGAHKTANDEVFADDHNKVYTQRLQDQISLLGKSQPNASRPSKSIPSSAVLQAAAAVASVPEAKEKTPEKSPAKTPSKSSPKKPAAPPTPGAFPDDDEEEEEEWIAPPPVPEKDHIESSPRPALPKSYTADIMEGIHGIDTVSGAEFVLPKQRQAGSRSTSPQRGPAVPERTTSTLGHTKSASVSVLPGLGTASRPAGINSPLKAISVSNPALMSVSETGRPQTPQSPSRSFRDSPLKQVKNKLSSIIKSSRGLLASSAAISAEGKSMLSPSSTRLGFHAGPSTSSLATLATTADSLYPDLSQRATNDAPVVSSSGSPTRPVAKRTRSSTEREKEEKRKEKETQKEARVMNEQMDKLEKAREKEREKALDAPPSVPRSAEQPGKPCEEKHSQYHPSNSSLSSNLHDTLGTSQPQLKSKASSASLQQKPSLSSLRGSTAGRPKALELAAKRKEVEEKEAQRKRDAKAEIERKRAALQEEERKQEQQKRLEAEKQKAKEREQAASQAEAKKNAARQAAIERAKQTRAPPPAVRAQPTGPPDYNTGSDKAAASNQPPRPVSRMNTASQRPQEDLGRPVSAVLNQGAKAPPKRPLQQETNDGASRHPQARNGPSYQAKDAKRRRTSDDFFDELDMDSQPPNIKGPPFSQGGDSLLRPTPNPAGPSHKTPARPQGAAGAKSAAKSATRSSPRFQNGESIELPEIDTDDEDEEEDDANFGAAAWVDSPELRRALTRQETMDPSQIFGPPVPLVMEEVFSKSKDRWHKFRARTSSANWSGTDRLTEDEIRKDLVARDRMRKDGAWTFEMSKDLA